MATAPPLPAAEATRALIIDDSAVARAVLSRMVEESGDFAVVASVDGPPAALTFLANHLVDLILLDLEMPGIDGLTALPDLLVAARGAKILVVSSACEDGTAATVQALALGAADTLVKPGSGINPGRFSAILQEKLLRLSEPVERMVASVAQRKTPRGDFDLVAIGASTGGIHALTNVLRPLPSDFDLPILITQHLPPAFTPYFAAQLAVVADRPCDPATDGLPIRPGRIVVAPGDAHIEVHAAGRGAHVIRLVRGEAASGCLPSVDPMLSSLARLYGPRLLAIVLTGMGSDGLIGAGCVRDTGGTVIVQDQASSVVWGMPGTIAKAGLADAILTPDAIGALIAGRNRP